MKKSWISKTETQLAFSFITLDSIYKTLNSSQASHMDTPSPQ